MNYDDYDKYYRPNTPDKWGTKWPNHPYENFHKEVKKVKSPTLEDLFPKLDRWGIGILDTLEHLRGIAQEKPSYPPYNIKKYDNGVWRIDMAVAGFRKEELAISVEDRTLTVKSEPVLTELDDQLAEAEVIHQGIAQRNFSVNFALAEYVEVDKAEYADGILTIHLITNIPEEKKPKVIDIQ